MSFERQIGDILKQLAAKNELHGVEQYINNLKTHHGNPVYLEAREQYYKTQLSAINKGAGKYPETLNPDNWTVDELAQHAWDELVDGGHYLTALKIKSNKLEKKLELLSKAYDGCNKYNSRLSKEVERWKNDCKEYAARLDMVNERLFQSSQDIARLDDKIAKLIVAKDNLMGEAASKIAQLERELEDLKNGTMV